MDKRKRYILGAFFTIVIVACLRDPPAQRGSISLPVLVIEIIMSAAICGLALTFIDEWKGWFNATRTAYFRIMSPLRRSVGLLIVGLIKIGIVVGIGFILYQLLFELLPIIKSQ